MADEPRYRFGPLEQHGFLMGLRAGQVGGLGAGLLLALAIVVLSQQPLTGVVVGVVVAAAVFVPLRGRTLEQWAPVVAGYAVRRALGRHRWTSQAPARGHRLRGRRGERVVVEAPVALPPGLRGLSILTATDNLLLPADLPAGIGIIRDRAAGTYAAVLRGHGRTFALCDEAEQASLVGGWAEVLASMADSGSPIRRLQVIERTLPDTGEGAARYLQEEMRRPAGDDPVRSYLELLDAAAPVNQGHETLVVLQVDARKLAGSTRQFKDRDLAAYVALVPGLGSPTDP